MNDESKEKIVQRLKPVRILQGGMGKTLIVCCRFNVQGAKGWRTKAKRWHPCLRKLVRKSAGSFHCSKGCCRLFIRFFSFYCYPNATIVLLFADGAWRCRFNIFFSVYVAEKIENKRIYFANLFCKFPS